MNGLTTIQPEAACRCPGKSLWLEDLVSALDQHRPLLIIEIQQFDPYLAVMPARNDDANMITRCLCISSAVPGRIGNRKQFPGHVGSNLLGQGRIGMSRGIKADQG